MNTLTRVALGAGIALAAITPVIASHSWGPYHWAGDGKELDLTVNLAITSQWNAAVNGGIADWEQSKELTFATQAATGAKPNTCKPIPGQLLVCNYGYGRRGWLGIATIWISAGNHIVQATTQLNDSYHDHPPYNSAAWRSLVACQEVGHDFGLDHQDEAFNNVNLGTCMDYTSAPAGGVLNGFNYGPSNEHPNDHDYDQIKVIYNHDDGTSGAATNFGVREVGKPAAPAAGQIDSSPAGLGPSEWGRAIRSDRQGRPNVFEKQLGSGQKRITHVFWALETKRSDIR